MQRVFYLINNMAKYELIFLFNNRNFNLVLFYSSRVLELKVPLVTTAILISSGEPN